MKVTSKMLAGAFIIAIMVLSVFGFVLSYGSTQNQNTLEFNDIAFRQTQQGWYADIAGAERQFIYHPLELNHLTFDEPTTQLLTAKSVIISYDDNTVDAPVLAQAQFYMEQTLDGEVFITRGLAREGTALPKLTCTDATPSQPVIMLMLANETDVRTEANCLQITARDAPTLIQYIDKVNYHLLKVING